MKSLKKYFVSLIVSLLVFSSIPIYGFATEASGNPTSPTVVQKEITKNVTDARQTSVGGDPTTLPDSLPYTDEDGFTGTLVKDGNPFVVSGVKGSPAETKTVNVNRVATLFTDTHDYPSGVWTPTNRINYSDTDGYSGSLRVISKDSLVKSRYNESSDTYGNWYYEDWNVTCQGSVTKPAVSSTAVWKQNYKGVVSKYIEQWEATKTVTDVRQTSAGGDPATLPDTIPYTDEEGFTGTLTATGPAYVVSGTQVLADTKAVSVSKWEDVYYQFIGGTLHPYDDVKVVGYTYSPPTVAYNTSGYVGTLYPVTPEGLKPIGYEAYWEDISDYDTVNVTYTGSVKRPASDTRVWKRDYSGNVIKILTTKNVTDSKQTLAGGNPATLPDTISYTDEEGFTGTLTATGPAYVVSGTQVLADTKTVSVLKWEDVYYQFIGGTLHPYDDVKVVGYTYSPLTVAYNTSGYVGTLYPVTPEGLKPIGYEAYWEDVSDYDTVNVTYTGSVTRQASDTRVWKRDYRGVVIK